MNLRVPHVCRSSPRPESVGQVGLRDVFKVGDI